jgi:hypothetical protein
MLICLVLIWTRFVLYIVLYRSKECVHFSQEWLQKSSEFKDFIRTQEDRPDVQGLKLNALLITTINSKQLLTFEL